MTTNNLTTSAQGLMLIKHYEGFRDKAYRDTGNILTIGFGHTGGIKEGDKITELDACNLLLRDLKIFEREINQLITIKLSQNQFDALASFVYNLGIGTLKTSTLLGLLNQGYYNLIPNQIRRFDHGMVGGKETVLSGLTKRRNSEAVLFAENRLILS